MIIEVWATLCQNLSQWQSLSGKSKETNWLPPLTIYEKRNDKPWRNWTFAAIKLVSQIHFISFLFRNLPLYVPPETRISFKWYNILHWWCFTVATALTQTVKGKHLNCMRVIIVTKSLMWFLLRRYGRIWCNVELKCPSSSWLEY